MRRITAEDTVSSLNNTDDVLEGVQGVLSDFGTGLLLGGAGIGTVAVSDRFEGRTQTVGTLAGVGLTGAAVLQLANASQGGSGSEPETPPREVADSVSVQDFSPTTESSFQGGRFIGVAAGAGPDVSLTVTNQSEVDLNNIFYGVTVVPPESAPNSEPIAFAPQEVSLGKRQSKTFKLSTGLLGNVSIRNIMKRSTDVPLTELNQLQGKLNNIAGEYTVRQSVWNKQPSQGLDGLVRLADTGNYSFTLDIVDLPSL